ncbi:MAG TPA: DNA polymerase III subunit delta' [Caulobacterales bacterium]|jgi:DNA polymerase-3 subunit delta'|nr:DNA polymerase III subunit delta' [Caulobacterales bacterium]
MTEPVEPDQAPGASHPRATFEFYGHEAQEQALAEALAGGRMHHAWLFGGPKGLGKATLAYRFARRLLGAKQNGARPLDVSADDPVARRIAANAHPDIFVLRRTMGDRGRYRREIIVDDARALGEFFSLMPAEGGWRVAIVDAADELNSNAANAILKTLEEPPPRSALMLVCHAPGATLATIRSRCRRLNMRPLDDALVGKAVERATGVNPDAAVLYLAAGRPGRAIALQASGVGDIAATVQRGMQDAPFKGISSLLPLAFERGGADRLDLTIDVAQDWLAQQARAGADAGKNEDRLAAAWFELEDVRQQAQELNLDATHALARTAHILTRAVQAK